MFPWTLPLNRKQHCRRIQAKPLRYVKYVYDEDDEPRRLFNCHIG
jgi:hypothetical protein